MGSIIGWIVALVALVRFLPNVNEEVGLQITSLAKGLVALWAIKSLALWFLPSVNEGVGLQMMICCTENNCTSWLHCGSACDSKGYLHLQMSWDIGHKTFDLPSFVLLSFTMTEEIPVNINCNSWSITFPFTNNSENEIFAQPRRFRYSSLLTFGFLSCSFIFQCFEKIGPKVVPYLLDHNVVLFKCGICQRQNEIRPKVKASRDKRLSRITAAIRALSLRSRSIWNMDLKWFAKDDNDFWW